MPPRNRNSSGSSPSDLPGKSLASAVEVNQSSMNLGLIVGLLRDRAGAVARMGVEFVGERWAGAGKGGRRERLARQYGEDE